MNNGSSASDGGYMKFANGFTVQWGKKLNVSTSPETMTVNFRSAFANAGTVNVYIIRNDSSGNFGGVALEYNINSTTASNFTFRTQWDSYTKPVTWSFQWIAIGF